MKAKKKSAKKPASSAGAPRRRKKSARKKKQTLRLRSGRVKKRSSFKPSKRRKTAFAPEKVAELIEKGKQRGFVTYSEIIYQFPDAENDLEGLDALYQKFELSGLAVQEVREYLNLGRTKEQDMREQVEREAPLDPVQMYLKEIGRISFVTADQEKELAKRIEKGDLEAKKQLARANL